MPGRTHEFGKYGARGIKGGEAIARQLDRLVTYVSSPITSPRGLMARINYLTRDGKLTPAARAAGLTVTDRTVSQWRGGMRKPHKANLQRIEDAYRTVRRQNVARALQRRLEANGGTRVEIHPLNQSQVPRPHQRALSYRHMNVRHWDAIIAAWAAGDEAGLHNAYIKIIEDELGSNWGEYEYVTNVGFSA